MATISDFVATLSIGVQFSKIESRRPEGRRHADEQEPGRKGHPPISVHEAKDKTIVVDFNPPLAGKTLNFYVKATDITAAEA